MDETKNSGRETVTKTFKEQKGFGGSVTPYSGEGSIPLKDWGVQIV